MNNFIKANGQHIIAIVVMALVSVFYFLPVFQGEMLQQHDIVQAKASQTEIEEYKEKNNEHILWTNAMFGGMPTYQINPSNAGNFAKYAFNAVRIVFPKPIHIIFLSLIGFYILGLAFNLGPWISLIGALAFSFASYNLISIEAGHLSKVRSMALMAPILAGVYLTFREKYRTGFLITVIFSALHIKSNHFQITYYLLILLIAYAIFEFINHYQTSQVKQFLKTTGILLVAALLATCTNASLLLTSYDYAQHTIRGGASELSDNGDENEKSGLDRDYAMRWSYGIGETMTLLIPNFKGGASTESLGKDSYTYETLTSNRISARRAKQMSNQVPTYWGPQPFTAGPQYLGAGLIFLFILSLLTIRSKHKWWILPMIILFLMLSWGKNFKPLADFFFNYFPMYSKFRTPSMILTMVQFLVPIVGVLGISNIVQKNLTWNQFKNKFYLSYGIVGGICLLFFLIGGSLFSYNAPKNERGTSPDQRYYKQYVNATNDKQFAQDMMEALKNDRAYLLKQDSLRSFIIISLIALGIWLYYRKTINSYFLLAIIGGVTLVDLWSVDKRYLNEEAFVEAETYDNSFPLRQADQKILQDPDPHFRVHDQTVDPYNNALPAYYHKLVGGYHAAKLQKYQDLIANQLQKGNRKVFDMLNTKYFITKQNGQPTVQQRPSALGNAWFVKNIQWEPSAEKEMNALTGFSPQQTAVANEKYKDFVSKKNYNGQGSIELVSYHPEKMVYQSNSNSTQLAVFSEVFYNGNNDWISKIDGEVTKHFKANYTLRALEIPPGQHKIVFEFNPFIHNISTTISYASSSILLLLLIGIPAYVRFYLKE